MHPLYGTLPVPYVPVRVRRRALVTHGVLTRLLVVKRTSQYRRTFIPFPLYMWNDPADPVD